MKLNKKRLLELEKQLKAHGYEVHAADDDFLCIYFQGMPVAAYQLDPDAVEGVLHYDVAGATPLDAGELALLCAKFGQTVIGEAMYLNDKGDALFGNEAWDAYEADVLSRNKNEQ